MTKEAWRNENSRVKDVSEPSRERRKIKILYRRPIERETRPADKQLLEQRRSYPPNVGARALSWPARDSQRAVRLSVRKEREMRAIRPRHLIRRSAIRPAIVNADRSRPLDLSGRPCRYR